MKNEQLIAARVPPDLLADLQKIEEDFEWDVKDIYERSGKR